MEVQKMQKKNKKPFEQRSYVCEVRAKEGEENGHTITGRPIVYEQVTDMGLYQEIISRGALDGADLTDVRFLVNHDISKIPLARSRKNNGNSTMLLTPDFNGMEIDVDLDIENNADSRSLHSAVGRGDVTGMSFMFTIEEEEWTGLDTDYPTRTIKKIGTVVEVSAVTFPAYESTEINARSKKAVETARHAVETARQQRETSVETDELKLLKEKTKILGGC
jgi:HK97 family phage prohead protease